MGVVLSRSTARVLPRLDTLSPAFSTFAARNAATLSGKNSMFLRTNTLRTVGLDATAQTHCRTDSWHVFVPHARSTHAEMYQAPQVSQNLAAKTNR